MRVAVVGAGPAGAVAALALARAGATTVLYERSPWPREKACGDGLTPASLATLASLGIALPDRPGLAGTLVSGPRERSFRASFPAASGEGTTVSRAVFDATLVRAAIAAGARFEPRTTVDACDGRRVVVTSHRGASETSHVDAVMLAEGATGALGRRCGFGAFGMRLAAYRGYADADDLTSDYEVHYARALLPGYAWVFPVAPRVANVGAVLVRGGDVRAHLRRWLATSARARRVFGEAPQLRDGRGGVIPIGRATRFRDGTFALGDAAGVADPLSAEGVSQAMTSALLATDALGRAHGDVARAGIAYVAASRAFDVNAREALRMRALFARFAEPTIALARRRPAVARHVVATGYFAKSDAAWFWRSFGALIRP